MMTVRDINSALLRDKTIVATYLLDGVEGYGRIIRVRRRKGVLQGFLLGRGRWAHLVEVREAT